MTRGAHLEVDVVPSGDSDSLLAGFERDRLPVALIPVLGEAFDVEVRDVRGEIREAPSYLLIVSDDDAGQSGEAVPGDVERAFLRHFCAPQLHLRPH